jgi:hypothetical protein
MCQFTKNTEEKVKMLKAMANLFKGKYQESLTPIIEGDFNFEVYPKIEGKFPFHTTKITILCYSSDERKHPINFKCKWYI